MSGARAASEAPRRLHERRYDEWRPVDPQETGPLDGHGKLRDDLVRRWRTPDGRTKGPSDTRVQRLELVQPPAGVSDADRKTFLSLKPNERIPASILNKYSTTEIAQLLVLRLHTLYEEGKPVVVPSDAYYQVKHISDFDYDQKAIPQLFFPLDRAKDIRAAGAFLNYHETGTSPTGARLSERIAIEKKISGLNLDYLSEASPYSAAEKDKLRQLLAKYTNIQLTEVVGIKNSYWQLSGAAGEGVAILKPEVKSRMTWCAEDSVALSRTHHREKSTAELIEQGHLGTFASTHLVGAAGRIGNAGNTYREGQVWGPLALEDVAYFMVPPGAPQESVAELRRTGRPVYEWSLYEVDNGGHTPQTFFVPSNFELGSRP